jgi:hypothetical protein
MAEDLRAPRFADQIIVFDHAAMTLKLSAGLQDENEMFVCKTHELRKVACAGDR